MVWGRKRACQGSARPRGLSHPHLPLKPSSRPPPAPVYFTLLLVPGRAIRDPRIRQEYCLKCTCIPMTRWTGLSQRPAVSVEAPEELSRPVEGTSPGADLARTCRRVHSSSSPEGLNRPEYDLNPIPAWVSAGRTARYLPAFGSLARSDAPFSRASQKSRGDLRCAGGTKVPNLGSGAPPRLGLHEVNRGCREPDAPSFRRQHQRRNPLCSGAPSRLSRFMGTSPVTSCDDSPPVTPPLRTAAARERREVEQVSRRPRAQLAGASLRSPRRPPMAEGARRTSPAQTPNCFL